MSLYNDNHCQYCPVFSLSFLIFCVGSFKVYFRFCPIPSEDTSLPSCEGVLLDNSTGTLCSLAREKTGYLLQKLLLDQPDVTRVIGTARRGNSLAKPWAEQALAKEAFMKYIHLWKNPARNVQSSLSFRNPKPNEIYVPISIFWHCLLLPRLIIGWEKNVVGSFLEGRSFLSPFFKGLGNGLERLSHMS